MTAKAVARASATSAGSGCDCFQKPSAAKVLMTQQKLLLRRIKGKFLSGALQYVLYTK